MTSESRTDPTRRHGRRLLVLALLAGGFAACGDAGDSSNAGQPAAQPGAPGLDTAGVEFTPPSINRPMPRPPGDTVAITATLAEYSVVVSPDTIDSGSISLLLQNDGERPHTIEIRGENGSRWVSLPIRPGGGLTMTMSIETGRYLVSSTDQAYVDRGMSGTFYVR